jgi:hypothetical protein
MKHDINQQYAQELTQQTGVLVLWDCVEEAFFIPDHPGYMDLYEAHRRALTLAKTHCAHCD